MCHGEWKCVQALRMVVCQGEWKCVQVYRMVVFQGELPFSIDVKGGEYVVGRSVMTAGGVLVLPSMQKGEIVD